MYIVYKIVFLIEWLPTWRRYEHLSFSSGLLMNLFLPHDLFLNIFCLDFIYSSSSCFLSFASVMRPSYSSIIRLHRVADVRSMHKHGIALQVPRTFIEFTKQDCCFFQFRFSLCVKVGVRPQCAYLQAWLPLPPPSRARWMGPSTVVTL